MKDLINTAPLLLHAGADIDQVVKAMIKRRVSSALIYDKHRVVVGIVTERDILRKIALLDLDRKLSRIVDESLFMTDEDENQTTSTIDAAKEERIKMMAKVVCICKGITLGRIMKGIEGCDTVADVNRKVGTGSGGCAGERCGPRLVTILRKLREAKEAKKK